MNLSAYIKELNYALRMPCNWRSRAALLVATLKFHFWNWLNLAPSTQGPIYLDLSIGPLRRRVGVRPYTGDVFILYEVFAFEAYFLPVAEVTPETVHVIVDCGANIGLTSLYFSAHYPNAKILAIEPDPANYRLLCENVAADERISPVHAAVVGAATNTVFLSQGRQAWGNSLIEAGDAKSVEVPSVTLSQIISSYSLNQIDLLKVDIEGTEKHVFANPDFLDSVGFVVVELHGDYTLQNFAVDIAPKGFVARPPIGHGGPRAVTAIRMAETG